MGWGWGWGAYLLFVGWRLVVYWSRQPKVFRLLTSPLLYFGSLWRFLLIYLLSTVLTVLHTSLDMWQFDCFDDWNAYIHASNISYIYICIYISTHTYIHAYMRITIFSMRSVSRFLVVGKPLLHISPAEKLHDSIQIVLQLNSIFLLEYQWGICKVLH